MSGTAIYLTLAISLPMLSSSVVSPTVAALLASITSVLVSYVCHHSFTFARVGQHNLYFPRFLVLSVVLSCVAAVVTHVLTEIFSIEYSYVAIVVAVVYPIASFTFNHTVVFRLEE